MHEQVSTTPGVLTALTDRSKSKDYHFLRRFPVDILSGIPERTPDGRTSPVMCSPWRSKLQATLLVQENITVLSDPHKSQYCE